MCVYDLQTISFYSAMENLSSDYLKFIQCFADMLLDVLMKYNFNFYIMGCGEVSCEDGIKTL